MEQSNASKQNTKLLGARFQALKGFVSSEHRWVFILEFYPGGRFLLEVSSQGMRFQELEKGLSVPSGFLPKNHPAVLYFKAHFLNSRISDVRVSPTELFFHFADKRDFLIKLLDLMKRECQFQFLDSTNPVPKQWLALLGTCGDLDSVEKRALNKAQFQREKLIGNIQKDIESAREWLEKWNPVLLKLEENPSLRGEFDFAGQSLDKMFALRRRMLRKQEAAQLRLAKVQQEELQVKKPSPKVVLQGPKLVRENLGHHVKGPQDIYAVVGRTAKENDELFRKARDRDLWFHVRGAQGGHVWIPRGQKGFGAKDDPKSEWIRFGALLALENSKLKRQGHADVDYTERRYLKKLKEPGQVLILRSQTVFVRTDS